jgi:hypothetical protein
MIPSLRMDGIEKGEFFNAEKVIKELDAAKRKVLSKFGAFVRQTARSSIRPIGKKGEPSPPGSPPKSREGSLKRLIVFAYEPDRDNVVIGPLLRGGVSELNTPARLEFGGSFTVTRLTRERRRLGIIRGKRYVTEARPFMRPAFMREMTKMPAMWANSIGK